MPLPNLRFDELLQSKEDVESLLDALNRASGECDLTDGNDVDLLQGSAIGIWEPPAECPQRRRPCLCRLCVIHGAPERHFEAAASAAWTPHGNHPTPYNKAWFVIAGVSRRKAITDA
jgi:hypothetical protein